MERYLRNPDLKLVSKNFKGNLVKDGQFSNYPWPDSDARFSKVLKWAFSPNPQRQEKKADDFRLSVVKDPTIFDPGEDRIVWLGHASFFIRMGGKNILIDPVLNSLPLMKRYAPFPSRPEQIRHIDYILLSHGHRDHFDDPSLKKIFSQNPAAKIYCPLRLGKLVNKLNKSMEVEEAGWYQTFSSRELRITMLPALHWHRRNMTDFNQMLWGSFMLEADGRKLFYAGDTAYGSHFQDIKTTMGEPEISILPIGAYKPTFLMKKSHMSPQEAIQAFEDLNSKKFIPMHYGTFDLANEPLGEPIRIVREQLNAEHLKELAVGEKLFI